MGQTKKANCSCGKTALSVVTVNAGSGVPDSAAHGICEGLRKLLRIADELDVWSDGVHCIFSAILRCAADINSCNFEDLMKNHFQPINKLLQLQDWKPLAHYRLASIF
jgi:hypothetical protein